MPHIERRSFVRGNFSFKIKFRAMTQAEYEEPDRPNDIIFPQFQLTTGINFTDKKIDAEIAIDLALISCLTLINDKLDLILELLDKYNNINWMFYNDLGANISEAGMNIVVDNPLETGQIIHTKFYFSYLVPSKNDLFSQSAVKDAAGGEAQTSLCACSVYPKGATIVLR